MKSIQEQHNHPKKCFLPRAFLGVFVFLFPVTASAYCLERTCEDVVCAAAETSCVDRLCERGADGCVAEGLVLKYPDPCLSFALEEGAGAPLELSDEELELVIWEAFDRWRFIDCGSNTHPNFSIQRAGLVESADKYFCAERPEENLSVWRSAPPCIDNSPNNEGCWGYQDSSLGYTSSTFSPETGVLFDADVELNVAEITTLGFALEERRELVLGIATHEAGHFLGVGHSNNPDAIMAVSYSSSSLTTRSFHQDDIDAICEAFPPSLELLSCPSPAVFLAGLSEEECLAPSAFDESSEGGCSIRGASKSRPVWQGAALLLLFVGWRRRLRAAGFCPVGRRSF